MKKTVMPSVREHGLLRQVAYAIVNPDRDQKLAEELTGGGPIPQLLMFRRKDDGWVRKKLVGGQTVEAVEEFIKDGLDKDAEEKKAAPAPKSESNDKTTARRAKPDAKKAS
jgi:thioredoxin-like negative regulator of GroEL